MSEKDLGKRIKLLEKQMLEHARNLEFEKAARVRDQLALLREQAFGAPGHDINVVPLVPAAGPPDARPEATAGARPVAQDPPAADRAARADGLHGQHLPLAHGRRRAARQAAAGRAAPLRGGRFGRHARLPHAARRPIRAPCASRRARGYDSRACARGRSRPDDFSASTGCWRWTRTTCDWLRSRCPTGAEPRIGLLMAHARRHAGVARCPTRTTARRPASSTCSTWSSDACDGLVERLAARARRRRPGAGKA